MRVLIVDDDPLVLDLIYFRLTREGNRVYRAKNFCEAKSIMERSDLDMVFLDYTLPDATAFAHLKYIRERFSKTRLPVSIMTSNRALQLKALEYGANGFMNKPFKIAELDAQVENSFELTKMHP